jgi:hypothetical protein
MMKEAAIRWAANAPSGALLAAAVRGELSIGPALRNQTTEHQDGCTDSPNVTRLSQEDGDPVVLKQYLDAEAYHREICNLRFYNAVARSFSPRLLACDDVAQALLIEDLPLLHRALTNRFAREGEPGPLAATQWSNVLKAIAAVHTASERQQMLLRRLYAPRWPAFVCFAAGGILEQMGILLSGQEPDSVPYSDRYTLLAADSWLDAQLASIAGRERLPILGVATSRDIGLAGDRVMFMRLDRSALGPRVADLAPTYLLRNRCELIETFYIAELRQRGARIDLQDFWEADAVLKVAALARLLVIGKQTVASESDPQNTLQVLVDSMLAIPDIEAAGRLLARLARL